MKKVYYWLIGILLFLIITNPTTKDFKEYLGDKSYKDLKKEYNVFVFSKYKKGQISYFAILGNFFKIEPNKIIKQQNIKLSDSAHADSMGLSDSAKADRFIFDKK